QELQGLEPDAHPRLHHAARLQQLMEVVGELQSAGGDARLEVEVARYAVLVRAKPPVQAVEADGQPGRYRCRCAQFITDARYQRAVVLALEAHVPIEAQHARAQGEGGRE